MQVEGHMKRLACVLERIDMNIIHVTGEARTIGEHLRKFLPLRLRNSAKAGAQRPIPISLGLDFKRGIKRAELTELAVNCEVQIAINRRTSRRLAQPSFAIARRDDRLFIP